MPAVSSSSSQVSSQTGMLPRHSTVAAEQDMEEVSSMVDEQAVPVTASAALQHYHSNAGSVQDASSLPSHLQPMQVTLLSLQGVNADIQPAVILACDDCSKQLQMYTGIEDTNTKEAGQLY